MQTVTKVETNVENLLDYNWFSFNDNDDDLIFVEDDNVDDAAKALKISPEAVKAIKNAFDYFAEELINALKDDLEDIWNEVHGEDCE